MGNPQDSTGGEITEYIQQVRVRLPTLALQLWLLVPRVWAQSADPFVEAQTPAPPKDRAGWNITAECQMVVLPQKLVLALLPDLLDETKFEATYSKLQELIAKGEAELAANLVVRAQHEETAVAESNEEFRYATEFDPPQLPGPEVKDVQLLKQWPVVGITPTAFETRNIGALMEIEPKLLPGGHAIDVKIRVQHVRLLAMTKIDAGRLANGERLSVEQPLFHSVVNTNRLLVHNGRRQVLGVHKLKEPKDTFELFFLRLNAAPGP
jgi:hypothetical protein